MRMELHGHLEELASYGFKTKLIMQLMGVTVCICCVFVLFCFFFLLFFLFLFF